MNMDRRDFLQAMAAAAAGLEVLGGSAITEDSGLMSLAKGPGLGHDRRAGIRRIIVRTLIFPVMAPACE